MSIVVPSMMGDTASKKWWFAAPVISPIRSQRAGSVRGPVATITMPSFGRTSTFSRLTSIRGWSRRAFVTSSANAVRSTTRALPPGMAVAPAARTTREPKEASSAFRRPWAFVSSCDLRELLQTSSPRSPVLWAGVMAWGRISRIRTRPPFRAI